ncbi:MAG: sigma-70 family RNA polymerase sigma factor [Salinarimonas sp.]
MMAHPDEEVWAGMLREALAGDETRYRSFLEAITPSLRRLVTVRAGGMGAADCEDILQDTLLAIHLKRHTWRADEPVRPWLFAIARYKIVDAFRARGRRVTVDIAEFAETLPAPAQDDPTDAGDIARVIAHLDPRSAQIVRAIGLEGAGIAETGNRLGMSEGAVRVALHRGLKKLAALRRSMLE